MTTTSNTVRHNPLLDRLREGEFTLILTVRGSRTADVLRIAKSTGHQAVMIDLEHSSLSIDTAAQLCASAGDLGLTPLVRVPEREYGMIGRLLDGGAHGIVFPRVATVAQAQNAVSACRFTPHGERSAIAMAPQLGMRPATSAKELNEALDQLTIVNIMIETPEGVANADAIAALDGVDILTIGSNDLTAELGVPGEYGHAKFRDAVATVAEACRKHGKLIQLGGIGDLDLLASYLPLGIAPIQVTGGDEGLLHAAAQMRAERLTAWYEAATKE